MTDRARPRHTIDLPVHQAPRRGVDITAIAVRYAWLVRVAYLVCIAIATLLNLGFDPSLTHAHDRFTRAIAPTLSSRLLVDGVRNIALFLGWGACWVITSPAPTTRRTVLLATALGMLASVTVEGVQLFSPHRVANVADVVTNTTGALLGALGFWLVERRTSTDLRFGTTIGVPAWLPAGALLVTAAAIAFAPSSRPGYIIAWAASPQARAAAVLSAPPVAVPPWSLLADAVTWLAAGVAMALAVRDRTGTVRGRQLVAWLLIATGVFWGVHQARACAGIRREDLSVPVQGVALISGLLAGLVGVPFWRRAVRERTRRATQVGLVMALLGAVMAWTPATWASPGMAFRAVHWRQLIPMVSLFERHDLASVALVLGKAGLGAAIGACFAARTRVGAPQPAVRLALAYATVLEAGQLVIPGRFPDITDVLITGAAATLVAVLVERASPSDGTHCPA
jgi:VanZ family protein